MRSSVIDFGVFLF